MKALAQCQHHGNQMVERLRDGELGLCGVHDKEGWFGGIWRTCRRDF